MISPTLLTRFGSTTLTLALLASATSWLLLPEAIVEQRQHPSKRGYWPTAVPSPLRFAMQDR